MGTGVGGFPFQLAAEVMTRTITDYLFGPTSISLVILSLFYRLGLVREDDLNLFYERAVARASEYTLSNRLNSLVSELKDITNRLGIQTVKKDIEKLQVDLVNARNILATRPNNIEHLEQLSDKSKLEDASRKVIDVSSQLMEETTTRQTESKLEEEILKTKLTGLETQLVIQISHKNRFEIERAKYGGTGIPPRLDTAIDDVKKEISQLEEQISLVKSDFIALHQHKQNS